MQVIPRLIILVSIICSAPALEGQVPRNYVCSNASFWSGGGAWPNSRSLFPYLAEWDGHSRPREIANFSIYSYDASLPATRNQIISSILAALPPGEDLDFILYQEHSTRALDVTGGVGSRQRFHDRAVAWGRIGQTISPGVTEVMLQPTWAYHESQTSWYPTHFANPAEAQAAVIRSYREAEEAIETSPGAGIATISPMGDAWADRGWGSELFRHKGGDKHASTRGELLVAMVAYVRAFDEDISDLLGKGVDRYRLNAAEDRLQAGANGIADIDDLLTIINANPESGDINEAITRADWQDLAATVDATEGFTYFGTSSVGSAGVEPHLDGLGCGRPGDRVWLAVSGGFGGASGSLLVGSGRGRASFLPGCEAQILPLRPVQFLFTLDGVGAGDGCWQGSLQLPPDARPGTSFFLQAALVDPGTASGFAFTNPMRLKLR